MKLAESREGERTCAVESTKDTKDHEEDDFEYVPRTVIIHVEHDKLPSPKRVHSLGY